MEQVGGQKDNPQPKELEDLQEVLRRVPCRVIAAAYKAGIQDPLKNVDWKHVLDPDLSQAKNLSLLEQRYGIRAEEVSGRRRKGPTPPGGTVKTLD